MLLSELVAALGDVKLIGDSDMRITDVTESSSEAHPGSIFVCIKGRSFDGADYINDARKRGAKVFVSAKKLEINADECLILAKEPRKTMEIIAAKLFLEYVKRLRIVAVGGTKGKTTVATLISRILKDQGFKTVLIGTLGTEYLGEEGFLRAGDAIPCKNNTTPSIDYLYRTLATAYLRGFTHAVIEVSSQALATGRVSGIPFSLCVFTNLSKDHIGEGEHRDFIEYTNAKLSLYRGSEAVANSDDRLFEKIRKTAKKCYSVGKSKGSDYYLSGVVRERGVTSFSLNGVRFKINLGGEFNAMNTALALASASVLLGRGCACFSDSISNVRIKGRYEVYLLKKRRVIIDFAHNKESFRAIMSAERGETKGKLIAVFGSVGNRCEQRRQELAEMAESLADISVITSDDPGEEAAIDICRQIRSFYKDKSKVIIETDREEAIKKALGLSVEGDSVLLLGKGHESHQLIGKERVPFSEKAILLSLGAIRQ